MSEIRRDEVWKHGFECGKKSLRQSREYQKLLCRIAELEAERDGLQAELDAERKNRCCCNCAESKFVISTNRKARRCSKIKTQSK